MSFISFPKLRKRTKNGLVAALFLVTQIGFATAPFLPAAIVEAAAACVNDQQGANDEPGQKDLTRMCTDDANASLVSWQWDDTGWTGSNTGDGCALFDTNNNGLVDRAVCVSVGNTPATQLAGSPRVFTCGDTRPENCTSALLLPGVITTTCTVNTLGDDPFNATFDTTASCNITLSEVGNGTLLDVCSYSSQSPTSDASDCIVFKAKTGKLEVRKDLVPDDVNKHFNLQVDAVTKVTTNGDGTTGEVVVGEGNHNVGETAGASTNLADYTSSISCRNLNGTGSVVASGNGTSLANVPVPEASDIVCIITNAQTTGTLELKKAWVGTPSQTTLRIGSTVGGSEVDSQLTGAAGVAPLTTGQNTANTGTYYMSETAITDYTASIACFNDANNNGVNDAEQTVQLGANNSVVLATGQHIICTFTNTRDTGSVKVNKLLDNDGNGTFETTNPGTFNWSLDGSGTNAMGSTVGGVETGNHSVNENTVTDYHLVGWYHTSDGSKSCANPDSTTLPANLSITKDTTTEITICNARDMGTLRVLKNVDLNGDGDFTDAGETGATNWLWQANGGSNHNTGDAAISVPTGSYALTETSQTDFHFVSLGCTGGTLNGNSVTVTTGAQVVCTFVNARDMGTITVNKVVDPGQGDDGLFNLQIDGATAGNGGDVGNGGTTGAIVLPTGSHTVSEVAGTNTDLDDYISSFSCNNDLSGDGTTTGSFTLSKDANITCTFTNVRKASITVVKDAVPNDAQDFNFTINKSGLALTFSKSFTLDDDSDPTLSDTELTTGLVPGSYIIHEDATAGWTLADVECGEGIEFEQEGSDILVTVAPGQNITCTFANTRDTGTITVVKNLTPVTNPGKFNLAINGTTYASNVGHNGTTQEVTLPTGTYNVGETVGTNTNLSDYESSYVCKDGDTLVAKGNGPTSVNFNLTKDQDIVCTFYNNKGEVLAALVDTGSTNVLANSLLSIALISFVTGLGFATRRQEY